jgi:SM-20-related protein
MAPAEPVRFALSPDIDAARLDAEYARTGRVSIAPFLSPESAEALRAHLAAREDWKLVMNAGANVYEMPKAAAAALSDAQRATLDRKLGESAVWGFQYRYESIRVPDDPGARAASGTLLDAFATFLSSASVLDMLRAVTGGTIDFADAQATAYGPGHFLTRHDDAVEGKHRQAAYVLGLSPQWRAEWGGLLLFHGAEDEIDHGFVPQFNALRLFRVPAQHSVSCVWPFAPQPRLSVTGWLRSFE